MPTAWWQSSRRARTFSSGSCRRASSTSSGLWDGRASRNILSPNRVEWRWAEAAAEIVRKPAIGESRISAKRGDGRIMTKDEGRKTTNAPTSSHASQTPPLRRIIHQRRSAKRWTGGRRSGRMRFAGCCCARCRGPGCAVCHAALAAARSSGHLCPPCDRVDAGPLPVCDPGQAADLHAALKPEFAWKQRAGLPARTAALPAGERRHARIASRISCGQDIVADGCFSLGMWRKFQCPLTEHGAWIYPLVFWECA